MEKVAQAKSQVQENEKKVEKTAEQEAAFKAKKAASAKAFNERQKERKANFQKFAKEVTSKPEIMKMLSPEMQKFATEMANPVQHAAFGGTTFLNKVFGDSPKVGDSVTLRDYMMKTFKSKAELDKRVKEWATKGITVEVVEAKNALDTVYKITKM